MTEATPKLPVSLAANPRLSSWIKFAPDGGVMLSPGKVEIGQGIVTALAQIAADELDVDLSRIKMVRASTAMSPNEGVTSGSLSIQQSGRAVRLACAEIRQIFLAAASERLGVEASRLAVDDGTISGPGNVRTSYWELADEVSLDRDATPGAKPKPIAKRVLAGRSKQPPAGGRHAGHLEGSKECAPGEHRSHHTLKVRPARRVGTAWLTSSPARYR